MFYPHLYILQWQNCVEAEEVPQGLGQIILTVETLGRRVPLAPEESPLRISATLHPIAIYSTKEPT